MISITMLTKNSESTLSSALEALEWAPEVVLLDTGSTDHTLEIAQTFHNVNIHKTNFKGFGDLHNEATALASHDWILSIDSDEIVTDELRTEIEALKLDPNCVYSIPRKNEFNGRWIRGCGWHPDYVKRLYNRRKSAFSSHKVHESILSDGMEVAKLKNAMRHLSYQTTSDLIEKMQLYSDLFARQYRHKRKGSLPRAIIHGLFTFFTSYLLQRGLFFGYEGFVISLYKAQTAYYKYLKLRELNRP